jgi:hypothetical protein
MRYPSILRKHVRALAATSMLMAFCAVANAYDTYNLYSHQLTIPAIQVGQTIYKNVVVYIALSQVISIDGGAPASTADNYVNGVLTIPVVIVNGNVYTNIAARVALSDVLYIGGHSAALACGSASEGGTNGVELYDPQNLFSYGLPLAANSAGPGALTWGAENLGTVYSFTGSLRASLWAVTAPFRGGTIIGDRIAESTPNFVGPGAYSPTQLNAGGYSYSSISALGTVATPSAGQYCMVITLDMYDPTGCASSDGYCTMDWLEFSQPAFFN